MFSYRICISKASFVGFFILRTSSIGTKYQRNGSPVSDRLCACLSLFPSPRVLSGIICLFDFIVDSNPSPTKDFSPKQTSGWIFFPHKVLTNCGVNSVLRLRTFHDIPPWCHFSVPKPRRIDQDIEVKVSAERGWCGERHSLKESVWERNGDLQNYNIWQFQGCVTLQTEQLKHHV